MLHTVTRGRPDRPAVVLLHGFLGCADDWAPVAEALAAAHFVVAADLPGHGRSLDLPATAYTPDGAVDALLAQLDRRGVRSAAWVGYSMGGRLALYAAAQRPQRVSRLILESASPGLADPAERVARRAWDEQIAGRLETEPLDRFLDAWYQMPLFAPLRAHPAFPALWERRLTGRPSELARAARGLGTGAQPPLWDAWPQLPMPVCLICGALDEKYAQIAARMAALRPGTAVAVAPDAGHTVHSEAADWFLAALRNALQE